MTATTHLIVQKLESLLREPVSIDNSAGYWTNFGISLALETVRQFASSDSVADALMELQPFMTCEGDGQGAGQVVFRFNSMEKAQRFHSTIVMLKSGHDR